MPRTHTPAPPPLDDDARISGMAAMIALGGHALMILAVLFLAGRAPEVTVSPSIVGVTLVSGEPGQAAPGPRRPASPLAPPTHAMSASPSDALSAGERLDRLIDNPAPTPAESLAAGASADRSKDSPPRPASGGGGRSGSSRANQGLGKGEGTMGVDLYAAASLPDVGARPANPPSGDLWNRVAPCWRPATSRPTTLIVALNPDGALAGAPQSVRRHGGVVDAQTLLAERAAVRALEACAPYVGIGARQWRVEFP